jgi:hypothetical protein
MWKETMMHEASFCGRTGLIAERGPTCLGDGDGGLTCPRCGHLDRLEGLPAAARDALVAEARRRREELGPSGRTSAVGRAA